MRCRYNPDGVTSRLLPLAALVLLGCSTKGGRREGPPDLILVTMDTLRADRVGAYGNPDGLTPNLDRFAAGAPVFETVYSRAPLPAPSHASLFTSRYPSEETSAA